MFKLGEYYEDEAKFIAGYLKDVGFKVEIKGSAEADIDITASIQGRLSELKGKIKILDKFERFLAALKAVVEKASTEESFGELFLTELDPGWKDKRDQFNRIQESGEEVDEETRQNLTRSMAEWIVSTDFVEKVIENNEIKLGEPVEGRLDDPILSIPVNPDDYEDDPMLRKRIDVNLTKVYEVYLDEFYTSLFREIDDDFQEEYYREYLKIMSLGLLIDGLVEEQSKGKIDIEEFADRCVLEVGDGDVLSIDGSLVAEEIARSLEKNGILKMKGNTIKWKA